MGGRKFLLSLVDCSLSKNSTLSSQSTGDKYLAILRCCCCIIFRLGSDMAYECGHVYSLDKKASQVYFSHFTSSSPSTRTESSKGQQPASQHLLVVIYRDH